MLPGMIMVTRVSDFLRGLFIYLLLLLLLLNKHILTRDLSIKHMIEKYWKNSIFSLN
jgi:hypothetical protein